MLTSLLSFFLEAAVVAIDLQIGTCGGGDGDITTTFLSSKQTRKKEKKKRKMNRYF